MQQTFQPPQPPNPNPHLIGAATHLEIHTHTHYITFNRVLPHTRTNTRKTKASDWRAFNGAVVVVVAIAVVSLISASLSLSARWSRRAKQQGERPRGSPESVCHSFVIVQLTEQQQASMASRSRSNNSYNTCSPSPKSHCWPTLFPWRLRPDSLGVELCPESGEFSYGAANCLLLVL